MGCQRWAAALSLPFAAQQAQRSVPTSTYTCGSASSHAKLHLFISTSQSVLASCNVACWLAHHAHQECVAELLAVMATQPQSNDAPAAGPAGRPPWPTRACCLCGAACRTQHASSSRSSPCLSGSQAIFIAEAAHLPRCRSYACCPPAITAAPCAVPASQEGSSTEAHGWRGMRWLMGTQLNSCTVGR